MNQSCKVYHNQCKNTKSKLYLTQLLYKCLHWHWGSCCHWWRNSALLESSSLSFKVLSICRIRLPQTDYLNVLFYTNMEIDFISAYICTWDLIKMNNSVLHFSSLSYSYASNIICNDLWQIQPQLAPTKASVISDN